MLPVPVVFKAAQTDPLAPPPRRDRTAACVARAAGLRQAAFGAVRQHGLRARAERARGRRPPGFRRVGPSPEHPHRPSGPRRPGVHKGVYVGIPGTDDADADMRTRVVPFVECGCGSGDGDGRDARCADQ